RHFRVRGTCESPYDSNLLAGVVDAYTDVGGNRTPLHVEQIRFYRVLRMQILTFNVDPKLLSDADACISVTSSPLISRDSPAAGPDDRPGFFQTVQQGVKNLAPPIFKWAHLSGGYAAAAR